MSASIAERWAEIARSPAPSARERAELNTGFSISAWASSPTASSPRARIPLLSSDAGIGRGAYCVCRAQGRRPRCRNRAQRIRDQQRAHASADLGYGCGVGFTIANG